MSTILGLSTKRSYESDADMATLRYGKLMLMTDQDHDGSHIKGLVINFLHFFFPKLLQVCSSLVSNHIKFVIIN